MRKIDTVAKVAEMDLSPRQRGDFQTPEDLASNIWAALDTSRFDVVIEPTFGLGSFIVTMPTNCKAKIRGWEIHREYYRATVEKVAGKSFDSAPVLFQRDVFTVTPDDLDFPPDASVLVVGNPPWVTNSEQGALQGEYGREKKSKDIKGVGCRHR